MDTWDIAGRLGVTDTRGFGKITRWGKQPVDLDPEFSVGSPRVLLELGPRYEYSVAFDVFPDGRFAMIRKERKRRPTIRIVLHWLDQLRDRR